MRSPGFYRLIFISAFFFGAFGCAAPPNLIDEPLSAHLSNQGAQKQCADFFVVFDRAVFEDQAQSISYARIPGFPYLRVDRFLASYSKELKDPAYFSAWVKALRQRDQFARKLEWERLNSQTKKQLINYAQTESVLSKLDGCAEQLMNQDFLTLDARQALAKRAYVDDAYVDTYRWLGLYPLTKWVVKWRINAWRDKARQAYGGEKGFGLHQPTRYQIDDVTLQEPIRIDIPTLEVEGVPKLDNNQLLALATKHAPVWEVDDRGSFDKIGEIVKVGDDWETNHKKPVVYIHPSYTRFKQEVFFQLNYLVWFAERPATRKLDIYSGNLDGVIWRVTFDKDFNPIFYDSIHACGCYHYVFHSPDYSPREPTEADWPVVITEEGLFADGAKVKIRLSSGDHQITKVSADNDVSPVYESLSLRPYQDLLVIETALDVENLFGTNGIVNGTSRKESLLLWPMGVPDAGAMRAFGKHATAFTSKQHFDDAFLFGKWFRKVQLKNH